MFHNISLFSFFFIFLSNVFSQNTVSESKILSEKNELKFKEFFFESLSQKAIGNYQKAIYNLENCNEIFPGEVSVFFEFSKNYLLLNNVLLSKEYIKRALLKEPNNHFMLKHLVEVCTRENNFDEAIEVQKKIASTNPRERENLVEIYIKNNDDKKAISLIKKIERDSVASIKLKRLKEKLIDSKNIKENNSLESEFKTNKSYSILSQLLEKNKNDPELLLKYSKEGILLYPSQAYLYLVNGKALNYFKKHKKALTCLQNGLDFVIDNKMRKRFLLEIAISYRGLGNFKEEKKILEKVKK